MNTGEKLIYNFFKKNYNCKIEAVSAAASFGRKDIFNLWDLQIIFLQDYALNLPNLEAYKIERGDTLYVQVKTKGPGLKMSAAHRFAPEKYKLWAEITPTNKIKFHTLTCEK